MVTQIMRYNTSHNKVYKILISYFHRIKSLQYLNGNLSNDSFFFVLRFLFFGTGSFLSHVFFLVIQTYIDANKRHLQNLSIVRFNFHTSQVYAFKTHLFAPQEN